MITGEGKCVGGSASTNPFSLTAPYTDFFLTNEPMKNGGTSMECWNPKDGVTLSCGIGDWSCKVMSHKPNMTIFFKTKLSAKVPLAYL